MGLLPHDNDDNVDPDEYETYYFDEDGSLSSTSINISEVCFPVVSSIPSFFHFQGSSIDSRSPLDNELFYTHNTEEDEYLYPPNTRQDSRSDHDKDDQEHHQQGELVLQGLAQLEHFNPTFPNQDSLADLKMLAEVAVEEEQGDLEVQRVLLESYNTNQEPSTAPHSSSTVNNPIFIDTEPEPDGACGPLENPTSQEFQVEDESVNPVNAEGDSRNNNPNKDNEEQDPDRFVRPGLAKEEYFNQEDQIELRRHQRGLLELPRKFRSRM